MNCPHCGSPNADEARFCGKCGRATTGTEPQSGAPGIAPTLNPLPDLIGKEIAGRYRMLAKLGEGGMGAVYRAEQISLKRTVAVKLLRPEVANSQMLLRRFNSEAELVAKLSHPNTVGIYDFGQDTDGSLFIAMEYIEGKSLRQVVHREAPLPVRRALWIAAQMCASLVDAHGRSIVHRDLKPDNVMLQERGREKDIVRVLDFGIAKLRDESRQTSMAMTQAGDMLGTPQYMAPEQIRGEAIDGRTDIYAIGCILYEMITGRLPFEAPTVMALLSKHLLESPPPPSQRRPELNISPAVDHLVMTAMAKEPNARPATMEVLSDQINALLAQFPSDSPSAAYVAQGPSGHVLVPTPPNQTASAQQFVPPSGHPLAPPSGHQPVPASGHHFTPPSAQTPIAPSAYAEPPRPAPITGNPYAQPQQHAPYNPHAPQGYAAPPAAPPKKSNGWIVAMIGIVALLGAGAGIYFGLIRKSAVSTPTEPVKPPGYDPFAVPAQRANPDPPGWVDPPDDPSPPDDPPPAITETKISRGGLTMNLPAAYVVTHEDADTVIATGTQDAVAIIGLPADASLAMLKKSFTNGGATYAYDKSARLLGDDRPIYRVTGIEQGIAYGGYCAAFVGPGHHAFACVFGAGGAALGEFDPDVAAEWASHIELAGAP